MRKLRLELDALAVDTFETAAAGGARGTVLGRGFLAVGDGRVGVVDATGGCGLSDGDTWCMDGNCTGDEQCTASTWTEPGICRTDAGCIETA